jgi:hypothetical protein
MRFVSLSITGVLAIFTSTSIAPAQVPPFNGGGAFAFDPEIGVVNSGALLDAEVVVSADRKYVTINARPSVSRLQALNVFPAQQVGIPGGGAGGGAGGAGGARMGFVGGAGFIDEEAFGPEPGTPVPEESAASAERRMRGTSRAPIPETPTQSSPSQILKVDSTASDSVLRKEGMHRIE